MLRFVNRECFQTPGHSQRKGRRRPQHGSDSALDNAGTGPDEQVLHYHFEAQPDRMVLEILEHSISLQMSQNFLEMHFLTRRHGEAEA